MHLLCTSSTTRLAVKGLDRPFIFKNSLVQVRVERVKKKAFRFQGPIGLIQQMVGLGPDNYRLAVSGQFEHGPEGAAAHDLLMRSYDQGVLTDAIKSHQGDRITPSRLVPSI